MSRIHGRLWITRATMFMWFVVIASRGELANHVVTADECSPEALLSETPELSLVWIDRYTLLPWGIESAVQEIESILGPIGVVVTIRPAMSSADIAPNRGEFRIVLTTTDSVKWGLKDNAVGTITGDSRRYIYIFFPNLLRSLSLIPGNTKLLRVESAKLRERWGALSRTKSVMPSRPADFTRGVDSCRRDGTMGCFSDSPSSFWRRSMLTPSLPASSSPRWLVEQTADWSRESKSIRCRR